ncbi:MAG: transglutaminase domain-containing protein [Hyphomonadaceae bacterium]
MRLRIKHQTAYRYGAPISRGHQLVRLFPSIHAGVSVMSWQVSAQGAYVGQPFADGLGNQCALVDMNEGAETVVIAVEGFVETHDAGPILQGALETLPPAYFLRETPLTAADANIRALMKPAASAAETAEVLMHAVRDRLDFRAGVTDVTHPAAEALAQGAGVCQDHAHLYVAAARAMGLPARYVSGYLFAGESHVASHAWVEARTEGGWLGLDPANRVRVGAAYVRLAAGLDYQQACPVAGVRIGGAEETLAVAVEVRDQRQEQ